MAGAPVVMVLVGEQAPLGLCGLDEVAELASEQATLSNRGAQFPSAPQHCVRSMTGLSPERSREGARRPDR